MTRSQWLLTSCGLLLCAHAFAQNAYIPNTADNNVSVIATGTFMVTSTITGFNNPNGAAASPDGKRVYIINKGNAAVTVIDTATNSAVASIPVQLSPVGAAVTP